MIFLRIQILRFVAASAVVLYHTQLNYELYFPSDHAIWFPGMGRAGVDLFFVISGFIIRYTIAHREQSAGQFLRRRIERIVPLYWTITLAFFVLVTFTGAARITVDPGATVDLLGRSLAFAGWTQGPKEHPRLYVCWSLEFEMFFYGLTAIALIVSRRPGWLVTGALAALVALGSALHGPDDSPAFAFFCNPMLIEFLMGWVVAEAFVRGTLPRLEIILCTAALLTITFADWGRHVWLYGVPSTALVAGAAWLDRRRAISGPPARLLARLGNASYSVYLVQVLTVSLTGKLLARLLPDAPISVAIIAAYAVTVAAGYAVYALIERPMLRLTHRFG